MVLLKYFSKYITNLPRTVFNHSFDKHFLGTYQAGDFPGIGNVVENNNRQPVPHRAYSPVGGDRQSMKQVHKIVH